MASQYFPYFNYSIFDDNILKAEIGGDSQERLEEFIRDDSSYLPNATFYNGLFARSGMAALFKMIYGLFLFEDNYHDFTDIGRINSAFLYGGETAPDFYLNVVKYTCEPWFFNAYVAFDDAINSNKKGDRKEDTLIRLFQKHGGEILWNAVFPGEEHAFKRRLLITFFIQKIFLSPLPLVRIINSKELAMPKGPDIVNDVFFNFRLDKANINPTQRRNFMTILKKILSPKSYAEGSRHLTDKIEFMSDATSFPYRYIGFNEFIDNFKPRASAQTLWDGASMDTFEGNLEYDITSDKPLASKLHSIRSNKWNIVFEKKKDVATDSEYMVKTEYRDGSFSPPALNGSYVLSSRHKGYTIKHMFEHAAYIKYSIDYLKLKTRDAALAAHIKSIYGKLAVDARQKGKNASMKPLYGPEPAGVLQLGENRLRSLLMIPIDGKGSCDADQAIYAGYRDYGFTTLDALCYFGGILNRTNSAYVVSSVGRIDLAKCIKDERKLQAQKDEFAQNRMAIQFKEVVNFFMKLNEFMKSLEDGFQLLFRHGEVYYKNDKRTRGSLGNMMKLYYLKMLDNNKGIIATIRKSQNVYNVTKEFMRLVFESTGLFGQYKESLENIEANIGTLFEIMQENDVFRRPLAGSPGRDYYEIYLKVLATTGMTNRLSREEATMFDLFSVFYMSIEKYISTLKSQIAYKKGARGGIAIDVFTALNVSAVTGVTDMMSYFVINDKKYIVSDTADTLFIDKFVDVLDEMDIMLKQLAISATGRRGQALLDRVGMIFREYLGIDAWPGASPGSVGDIDNAIANELTAVAGLKSGGTRTKPRSKYSQASIETLSVASAISMQSTSQKESHPLIDIYDSLERDISARVKSTDFFGMGPGILVGFIMTILMLQGEFVRGSGLSGGAPEEQAVLPPMNQIVNYFQNLNYVLSYTIYENPDDALMTIRADTLLNDAIEYIEQPIESAITAPIGVRELLEKIKGKLKNKYDEPILRFRTEYLYDYVELPPITDMGIFRDECIKQLQRLNFLCMSIKFEDREVISAVRAGTKRRRSSKPSSSDPTSGVKVTKRRLRNLNTT